MGNADWWDRRFDVRSERLFSPEGTLIKFLGKLKSGTVLDVASGDGRNAIWLAEHGFAVTAVDFSESALKRLKHFANAQNLDINMKQIDLSVPGEFGKLGTYDNIVINHYRVNEEIALLLPDRLTDGGILFVNGFKKVPAAHPDIREKDLICEDDFLSLERYCEKILQYHYKNELGSFITLIFKKIRRSLLWCAASELNR